MHSTCNATSKVIQSAILTLQSLEVPTLHLASLNPLSPDFLKIEI